uniref:Uncharacterized protein n=1 Tax=Vespula pensylvanica TaxID=30213 RepID=A0A834NLY0_VESPE|nr:hypothetical protein H0235_012984 [Vespula pensylvanica]
MNNEDILVYPFKCPSLYITARKTSRVRLLVEEQEQEEVEEEEEEEEEVEVKEEELQEKVEVKEEEEKRRCLEKRKDEVLLEHRRRVLLLLHKSIDGKFSIGMITLNGSSSGNSNSSKIVVVSCYNKKQKEGNKEIEMKRRKEKKKYKELSPKDEISFFPVTSKVLSQGEIKEQQHQQQQQQPTRVPQFFLYSGTVRTKREKYTSNAINISTIFQLKHSTI